MAVGAGLAPSESLASAAIGLTCVPLSAQTTALCDEFRALIAPQLPGRQVDIVTEDRLSDYDRALRLTIVTLRANGIAATLDWRGQGQDWQEGAMSQKVVMDAQLTATMTTRFLQNLWTEIQAKF